MLYFILGILIGLILDIIALLFLIKYGNQIERTIRNTKAKLSEKGEIFTTNEEEEDFKAFLDSLPKE